MKKELSPIENDPRFLDLIKEYKYRIQKTKGTYQVIMATMLSLFTSPLYTIATSMQLSVIPHLTIYGDVKPHEVKKKSYLRQQVEALSGRDIDMKNVKQLPGEEKSLGTELKFDLAERVKPRADLMQASGQVGLNQPYRAPIYRSYWECIQGLSKQGVLGFYKGNGMRVLHIAMYSVIRTNMQMNFDFGDEIFRKDSFLRDFAAATIASLLLHPIHFLEARYILQNRLPNFKVYSGIHQMIYQNYAEIPKGITAHIPRSFLLSLTGFNYFTSVNIQTYYFQTLLFHTLAYPILTAQRRIECQSIKTPGMLPLRYLGPVHCLGLMWREEGFKGIYRGYFAYLLATAMFVTTVPLISELMMLKSPLYGHYDDNFDLYKEVMKKSKDRKDRRESQASNKKD
eukprot:403360307